MSSAQNAANVQGMEEKTRADIMLYAAGAGLGAIIMVLLDGRGGVFAAFALVAGAVLGALTVQTRTLAMGWQGWVASIGLWWVLPGLMWWAA